MLNLLGSFLEKMDSYILKGFYLIEPQKRKKINIPPQFQKNKWQKLVQKRERKQKEQQKKIKLQIQQIEKDKQIQLDNRIRRNLHVNKDVIYENEILQFNKIKQSFGYLQTSFFLPDCIQFQDAFNLTQQNFTKIYNALQSLSKKSLKANQSLNSNLNDIKPVQIVDKKIKLFPHALIKYFKLTQAEFIKNIKQLKLQQKQRNNQQIYKASSLLEKQIQQILKQLRRAKIYRYKLNYRIHSLIGKYAILKKKLHPNYQIPELKQFSDWELSDIGLFSQEIVVDKNQEIQIMQYWKYRMSTDIPSFQSQPYKSYLDTLQYQLKIDTFKQFSMKGYFELLNNLQKILIQAEELKTRKQIAEKTESFSREKKNFEQIYVSTQGMSSKNKKVYPEAQMPSVISSTAIRLFKKWRSLNIQDGLSASSFILKLINEQVKYFSIVKILLKDYDTQVLIPRCKYIAQLTRKTNIFQRFTQQLLSNKILQKEIHLFNQFVHLQKKKSIIRNNHNKKFKKVQQIFRNQEIASNLSRQSFNVNLNKKETQKQQEESLENDSKSNTDDISEISQETMNDQSIENDEYNFEYENHYFQDIDEGEILSSMSGISSQKNNEASISSDQLDQSYQVDTDLKKK